MDIKCVLFDLDGTLLNTNFLVLESFKHTLRQHLGKEVSDEALYPYFGIPLVDIMKAFDATQVEDMLITYRKFNLDKHDELTTLFPGVEQTLEGLRLKGVRMGIVSSKIRKMVYKGLQLFNLDHYFDLVVAFEDTEAHKPNAAPILKALGQMPDIKGEEALMVGDSPFDIICAAKAGVKSAAVEWTVHNIDDLKEHKPDLVLAQFTDILKLT